MEHVDFMTITVEETEVWGDQISKLNWEMSDSYHLSTRKDVWLPGFNTKACAFRALINITPTDTERGEKVTHSKGKMKKGHVISFSSPTHFNPFSSFSAIKAK